MILSFLAWLALIAFAGTVLAEAWLPWRDRTDALERIVLTLGLGYAWAVVAGMALNATPWGVNVGSLIVATFALALVVGVGQRIRGGKACGRPRPLDRRTWLAIALVIAFAALFRLPNLGWSEFQGDEALVLHKAAATIDGRHDAIYVHKKGPAEILVTAEVYAITRRIDEGTARLPFAVAMLAGLAALIVVGRGLFGPKVGVWAALILGLNGFFIAFGRVVQYQALVFLFGTLAIWCAWRYRKDQADDAPRWLLLTALFLACGLLSHYDAALVAPAILWLVVARWRAERGSLRRDRWAIAASILLGAVLLASFYVPFVLHPYFRSTTLKYLVEVRMGGGGGDGGGAPYDALPKWAGLANFYNSAYYLLALGLLVAAVVTKRLVARWPRAGWALAALGAAGVPALLLRPQWFALTTDVEGRSWAIVLVAALALAPLIAVWRDDAWVTVWLWLIVPFVFYSTLVESPRTHFHTVFPALSILAAMTFSTLSRSLYPAPRIGGGVGERSSPGAGALGRWAPVVAVALCVVVAHSGYYGAQVFVQHEVSYKRSWPAVRVPMAWYPFDDLPGSGWFGFPYRAGWKYIGGTLLGGGSGGGDYDSNEEPAVTAWYTRGAPRCGDQPKYVFVATRVQDRQPVLDPDADEAPDEPPPAEAIIAAGYKHKLDVRTNGEDSVAVWERRGVDDEHLTNFDLAPSVNQDAGYTSGTEGMNPIHGSYTYDFDLQDSDPHYDAGLPFDNPARIVDEARDDVFGSVPMLALRGWRYVAPSRGDVGMGREDAVAPGDRIILSLAWAALDQPIPPNAQVFVHLEREGVQTLAQSDGPLHPPAETVCGKPRVLSSLAAGEEVLDRRVIDVPADAKPGSAYYILVGIYDYETGERLPVIAGLDKGQNRVRLTIVTIANGSPLEGHAP
ncbi:MAG: glycosyltransferase family 39 protein [Ardenticatenales bacterium]